MRSAPADDDRRISSNDRPLSLSSISLPVHAPDSPEASPLEPHIEANDYRSSHDSVRYVNQQQDGHARNRTQQQENLVHGECGPEGWTVEGEKGMDRFVHVRIFGGRSYPGSTSCRQEHRPVYPGQPDVWQRTPPETAAAPYLEPSCSACARSPTSAESSRASSAAACDTSFSYEIRPSRSNDLPTHDQLLKQRLADLSLPMGH